MLYDFIFTKVHKQTKLIYEVRSHPAGQKGIRNWQGTWLGLLCTGNAVSWSGCWLHGYIRFVKKSPNCTFMVRICVSVCVYIHILYASIKIVISFKNYMQVFNDMIYIFKLLLYPDKAELEEYMQMCRVLIDWLTWCFQIYIK